MKVFLLILLCIYFFPSDSAWSKTGKKIRKNPTQKEVRNKSEKKLFTKKETLELEDFNPPSNDSVLTSSEVSNSSQTVVPDLAPVPPSSEIKSPTELKLKISGMLKTDFAYADKAVLSFGYDNLIAPTMAKREVQARDSEARSGIYPTSSLLGFELFYGKKMKGYFEADFVDLTKAQAGTETRPRVRQIVLKYEPNSSWEFFMGRTWDLFAGILPHTFNASAYMGKGGNVGWMREQIGVWYKIGNLKFASAIGTTNFHTDANVRIEVERNSMPTVALRTDWTPIEGLLFTLSALGTRLKIKDPATDSSRDNLYLYYDPSRPDPSATPLSGLIQKENEKRTEVAAGGISFGFSWKWGALETKGEATYGTNLGSLNAFGISEVQGTTYGSELTNGQYGYLSGLYLQEAKTSARKKFHSPREVSGFLSINYEFSFKVGIGLHAGVARISNPSVLIGADPNQLTISLPDSNQWTLDPIVLGSIRENQVYGLRFYYDPEDRMRFFLQTDLFRTFYKDVDRYESWRAHVETYDPFVESAILRDPGNANTRSSAFAQTLSFRLGGSLRLD
ncbi:hypothetical protein AB3N59_12440 [Leptospira sp. WS92.C1]